LSQGLGDTNTAPRFALYVAVFVSPSPWLFSLEVFILVVKKTVSDSQALKNSLLHRNGVGWLGGNINAQIPLVKYILKISHKGLLFGSYSDYQKALSDKVLDFRDRRKLMFKEIAEKLILEGYKVLNGSKTTSL